MPLMSTASVADVRPGLAGCNQTDGRNGNSMINGDASLEFTAGEPTPDLLNIGFGEFGTADHASFISGAVQDFVPLILAVAGPAKMFPGPAPAVAATVGGLQPFGFWPVPRLADSGMNPIPLTAVPDTSISAVVVERPSSAAVGRGHCEQQEVFNGFAVEGTIIHRIASSVGGLSGRRPVPSGRRLRTFYRDGGRSGRESSCL